MITILLVTLTIISFIFSCYFSYTRITWFLKIEKIIKKSSSNKKRRIIVIYKSTITVGILGGITILISSIIKGLKTPPDQILLFWSIFFTLITIYIIVTIIFPIRLLESQIDSES